MIDRLIAKSCTGCLACVQACPKKVIRMGKDGEGFYVPQIEKSQCLHCNLCERTCPQLTPVAQHTCLAAYAARCLDDLLLSRSASGGLFAALARHTLSGGGVVFGARMDAEGIVQTVGIAREADLPPLQGSKYVQSYTGTAYREAAAALHAGKRVLFSGTPCQIAGLYGYLGQDDPNLITMDIVCHGVPSQDLYTKYRAWLEKQKGRPLVGWDFRCKERDNWGMNEKLTFTGRKQYIRSSLNPYTRAFMLGYTYRESCYRCRYACDKRVSDMTVGDYWGIEKVHPAFYSPKGVSLLLVNTPKGKSIMDTLSASVALLPSRLRDMQKLNGNLVQPTNRPPQREEIYHHLYQLSMDEFVRRDLKVPFLPKERLLQWLPAKARRNGKRLFAALKRDQRQ